MNSEKTCSLGDPSSFRNASARQQDHSHTDPLEGGTSMTMPMPSTSSNDAGPSSQGGDFLSSCHLPPFGNIGGVEPESFFRRLVAERPTAGPKFLCGAAASETNSVDYKHREMAVNWLMHVRERFKLRWSTYAAAVVLNDRFLKSASVHVQSVRLVALTCLWIAAKHEELRNIPRIFQLVEECQGGFTETAFRSMELEILTELNFNLCTRTPFSVVGYLCEASAPRDRGVQETAHFAAKVAMLDTGMASERPFIVALAIVHLSLVMIPDVEGQSNSAAVRYLPSEESVRELMPRLVNMAGKEKVVRVAKKLLDFWCFLVESHDNGNRIVLVRRYPNIAGRIFTKESDTCLRNVYGCSSTNNGSFALWASRQSLRQLLQP